MLSLGTPFRFCLFYFLLTTLVLLAMLHSCARVSQSQFLRATRHTMETTVRSITIAMDAGYNLETIYPAIDTLGDLRITRLRFTDSHGQVLYDSHPDQPQPEYAPEAFVMAWYARGTVYGQQCFAWGEDGWVWFSAENVSSGSLLQTLHWRFSLAAVALVLTVTCVSAASGEIFSRRLRTIVRFVQRVRDGDYTQAINLEGDDDLSLLAREFDELTERLREAELQQRRFVSDASHELKTPLASIKLLADSILHNDLDCATTREFVADISQEAERLTRLSGKLLSLQPIQADEQERIDLGSAIYHTVKMLSPIADQAQVTIHMEAATRETVWMPQGDLHQILYNLLENAIKYNRPGGSVTLRLRRQADQVMLQVCDTGMGIPADSVGLVFQRFYRVDKARSRQSGGSGLGLAIVQEKVERNGGTICLSSVLGEGSCFTVTFPRAVSEPG